MKKTILMMAFAIATLTAVSCKDEKKAESTEAATEEHAGHDHEATEKHYVCPMDCEKGKTYEAAGKCPECDMDLIKDKHTDEASHEGHDH